MRTIIVDDEIWMLERFELECFECAELKDVNIVGKFSDPHKALKYAENNPVDLAFLDISMPVMNGIKLAEKLKKLRKEIVIIYISSHCEDMPYAFRSLTADYFIIKPYRSADVKSALEKAKLLSARQKKDIFIRTFGNFTIYISGEPMKISGKAKEILALLVSRRGKELSNGEIYMTMWENREYNNVNMKVYYNALKRLKKVLKEYAISEILMSTQRGQMVNTDMFDCDYYWWKDGKSDVEYEFEGEFLQEYSWGEYILAGMMKDMDKEW